MNQSGTFVRGTLLGVLLIAVGLTAWGTANAADDGEGTSGPCKAKTFNFAVIARACKTGGADGRNKVRDIMKAARDKAKDKDIKINDHTVGCKSCHKDTKVAYDLTNNAVADLRKLLDDPTPVTPKKKP
jgi:hypothetical protein